MVLNSRTRCRLSRGAAACVAATSLVVLSAYPFAAAKDQDQDVRQTSPVTRANENVVAEVRRLGGSIGNDDSSDNSVVSWVDLRSIEPSDDLLRLLADLPTFDRLFLPPLDVTDTLVERLGAVKVDRLFLDKIRFTDANLRRLNKLTNVKTLHLTEARDDRGSMDAVSQLSEIPSVALHVRTVTDAELEPLLGLKNIRELMCNFVLPENDLEYLPRLTDIRSVVLRLGTRRDSHVNDAALSKLRDASNITGLWIYEVHADVTDAGIRHLRGLTRMRSLHMRGLSITDAGLAHLAGMTELEDLDLKQTQVTDAGWQHLAQLKKLKTVNLGGTSITDDTIRQLADLQKLHFLLVPKTRTTDAGLQHLGRLKQLDELGLSSTDITDAGLRHLSGLRRLEELSLGGTAVTDAGLHHLSGMQALYHLDLRGTAVTDAGLEKLKSLGNLRRLYLDETRVTDQGLSSLVGLKALRELHIDKTRVTTTGVRQLERALPKLVVFGDGNRDGGFGDDRESSPDEPAEQADDARAPQLAAPTIVVAEHVILLDGRLITLDKVVVHLDQLVRAGPMRPTFKFTTGSMPRREGVQGRIHEWYKQAYDGDRVKGYTIGFMGPRPSRRYDAIETEDDLEPDLRFKQTGKVQLADGQPVESAEIAVCSAEEVRFGVYLENGRLREPVEERVVHTDKEGRFTVFPETERFVLLVLHPCGFAQVTSDQLRNSPTVELRDWTRVTGRINRGPRNDQQVHFAVHTLLGNEWPPITLHDYSTRIDRDGAFDQAKLPPGQIVVQRSVPTGEGVSVGLPVDTFVLNPGARRTVDITQPLSEEDQRRVRELSRPRG